MEPTEPLTAEQIAKERKRHVVRQETRQIQLCNECVEPWPCAALRMHATVDALKAELAAVLGKIARVPHCWEFKAEGETTVEIDRVGRSHRSDECARLGGQCQFEETHAER